MARHKNKKSQPEEGLAKDKENLVGV